MNTFKPLGRVSETWRQGLLAVGPLLAALGCGDVGSAPTDEGVVVVKGAVTNPVTVCNQDPRVTSGLVPVTVCAGARVFFDETFGGNGRTCGTCHPAQNNFTLDSRSSTRSGRPIRCSSPKPRPPSWAPWRRRRFAWSMR